jgi:sulfur-oxidizing protein SoxY
LGYIYSMIIRIPSVKIARRSFLSLTAVGGAALVAAQLLPSRVLASRADVVRAVEGLTGGVQPEPGKIRLDLPEVAEYGDTVPLTVEVESPMTDTDYVESVYIFAEENPVSHVLTFNFTPMSGRARVSTRIRLAKTQEVMALARMSNGEFYTSRRLVKVTVGGCG